jgi:hypothetical protein
MALTRWRRPVVVLALLAALAVPVLAYLRDPPWLATTTSGLRGWEQHGDDMRFRWMTGHASFFVPADARTIELPVRTTFGAGDWPITVTVSIDDRPADRITLADDEWHAMVLRLPAPGSRKVRRVDIRLDRNRDDDHGAMIGEPLIN